MGSGNAGAWREVNTARRSGANSPGGIWAGPGGNAVVLAFDMLFVKLTMMLGSGDAVP